MSAESLACASSFSEETAAQSAFFGHSRRVRARPVADVRGVACVRKLVFRGNRRAGRVLWTLPAGAARGGCPRGRLLAQARFPKKPPRGGVLWALPVNAKGPPAWGGPHLFYSSGRFFHSAACFPQCMQSPVQPLQPPVRCCSMARSANAAAISTSARTTAVPGVITPPPAACRRAARRRPPPRRWRTARARRRTPTARRAHAGRTRSPRRTAYTAGRTRASSSQKAA